MSRSAPERVGGCEGRPAGTSRHLGVPRLAPRPAHEAQTVAVGTGGNPVPVDPTEVKERYS